MGEPAIAVRGLRKSFGAKEAVAGIDLEIAAGSFAGLVGPNGAGKTTTVECAIGLRSPDSGTIRLLGLDPQADRGEVHEIVGAQLQSSAFPPKLRVGEILDMYRSFYRQPADVGELWPDIGRSRPRNGRRQRRVRGEAAGHSSHGNPPVGGTEGAQ